MDELIVYELFHEGVWLLGTDGYILAGANIEKILDELPDKESGESLIVTSTGFAIWEREYLQYYSFVDRVRKGKEIVGDYSPVEENGNYRGGFIHAAGPDKSTVETKLIEAAKLLPLAIRAAPYEQNSELLSIGLIGTFYAYTGQE